MSEPATDPAANLRTLLEPILAAVAELDPAGRSDDDAVAALERALETRFPARGEYVRALGDEISRGVAEGWLCNRGPENARFSRLAKPSSETGELSIDCVSMEGDAIDHTHPNGEVTIGFAAQGADPDAVRFEGRPAGWVFLRPGTRHIPRVTGGRMNLMYFLPGGAVEWHMD